MALPHTEKECLALSGGELVQVEVLQVAGEDAILSKVIGGAQALVVDDAPVPAQVLVVDDERHLLELLGKL
jgi:hypothetical protein